MRDWAVAGLGVTRVPRFLVEGELRRGALADVLPGHVAGRPVMHALYLPGRYRPANAGRLIAHAVAWFAARPGG